MKDSIDEVTLNESKCVAIIYNSRKYKMKFRDNTPVNVVQEATYLGCNLNKDTDMMVEIKERISKFSTTLAKMDAFWLHSAINLSNY